MPRDTALSPDVQADLERAIRDVLAGASRSDLEIVQEVRPAADEALDLDIVPEASDCSLFAEPNEQVVGVWLFFDDLPDGDVPLVPDDVDDPDYDLRAASEEPPTYLRELGGDYAALSAAIVDTLVAFCGGPEDDPEAAFLGPRADLRCAACNGDVIAFSAFVRYPAHVAEVYGMGV
jgi:hypothetical protein